MVIPQIKIDHLCNLARVLTSHTVLTMRFIIIFGKIDCLYCWNIKANWDKASFQRTVAKNAKKVTFSRMPSVPKFLLLLSLFEIFWVSVWFVFQIQLFSKIICKYRNFFVGSWDRPPSPSSLNFVVFTFACPCKWSCALWSDLYELGWLNRDIRLENCYNRNLTQVVPALTKVGGCSFLRPPRWSSTLIF